METEGAGPDITRMLREWSDGKPGAADELASAVYSELRRRAAGYLRRERAGHSFQTTDLVHETYLKLVDQERVEWKCRGHFFAIAATSMRRILVDRAKRNGRAKRGGPVDDVPIDEARVGTSGSDVDLVALDEALRRLKQLDPQQERLVELRYFAGLKLEDAAEAIGISRATAARDWNAAKAWLRRELTR